MAPGDLASRMRKLPGSSIVDCGVNCDSLPRELFCFGLFQGLSVFRTDPPPTPPWKGGGFWRAARARMVAGFFRRGKPRVGWRHGRETGRNSVGRPAATASLAVFRGTQGRRSVPNRWPGVGSPSLGLSVLLAAIDRLATNPEAEASRWRIATKPEAYAFGSPRECISLANL